VLITFEFVYEWCLYGAYADLDFKMSNLLSP